ncbi:MAG: formate dehydrogenase subunit alpha [Anaerolineae bacterium]|nr:MAG: formate dehydrogenase subunit alpha [Anaerolineae bacterium]
MATVTLTIDGKKIQAESGQTILQAAQQAKIRIPTLCHHPALPPEGACRICLVEIEKQRSLQPACTFPVSEGLVIHTHSPKVLEARKFSLELLLSDHPLDCMTCQVAGACVLQDLAYEYNVSGERFKGIQHRYEVDTSNPFIVVDRNKCVLCRLCVRACNYANGVEAIGLVLRGFNTHIGFGADSSMQDSPCEFCGSCEAVCPVGALLPKMSVGKGRSWQVKKVRTVCSYCGVGCQLELEIKDNRIVKVNSVWDAPANHGWLCVKGRYGYDYVHHPDRLTKPRVRRYLLEGKTKEEKGETGWEWVETDWDTALEITAHKLRAIRDTFGPNSIGILASAKCTNEENYLMNKFARQVIGTNNIDHCARLCHSSTVAGLATSFGSGAMSNSIDDITEQARAIFIIGSNTTEQHPVIGMRIRQAVKQRGARLIVADPRRIEITKFATAQYGGLHLRHRPGTDIALLNGLMYIILQNGWEDKDFIAERCEGFEEFQETVKRYPPERVSQITGVPPEQLYQAAEIMGKCKPMTAIWAMGITQHIVGVRNVMSLANLQMLLGNMGKPGGGTNPLRGQNNVQGACDMGGLPNVFPAYQPVTHPEVIQKFTQAWGSAPPPQVGLTVTEMIPSIAEKKIRALYILAEDPVMSDADANHTRHCLQQADFIVLQEIFPTETSPYADVLLPGVTFAEKDGTFTNTERRVQRVRKAIEAPGQARQDWEIITEIAKRIMHSGTPTRSETPERDESPSWAAWDYTSPADILREINALAPSYGGITHDRLERGETLQWPCPSPEHPGTPILHTKGFARGKGQFMPIDFLPPTERPDEEYPFILSTGRVLYHWHGGELSRRASGLLEIYHQPQVELNPLDAEKLGLLAIGTEGQKRVRVTSRRGSIESAAWITERVPPGMVYANFHFPEASANELTLAALDPISKIPSFKVCAVRVEAA